MVFGFIFVLKLHQEEKMLESNDPAMLGTCSLDKSQIDFCGNTHGKRLCMNDDQLAFQKCECAVNTIIISI